MNRKELVRGITEYLRANQIRKEISFPKHTFTITDDSGAKKNFVVRKSEKTVAYNMEDVDAMIGAMIDVVLGAIRDGDEVFLKGLGTFYLKYKEPYRNMHPGTGEWVTFGGTYKPGFKPSRDMRVCAKVYELKTKEQDGDASQIELPEEECDPDGD